MTSASPRDLAVTFRSIPRRLRQALGDDAPTATSGPVAELQHDLAEAGRLLMTTNDPTAIAVAIEATPADEWDVAVLARLRALALDMGARLRSIEAMRPDDD